MSNYIAQASLRINFYAPCDIQNSLFFYIIIPGDKWLIFVVLLPYHNTALVVKIKRG